MIEIPKMICTLADRERNPESQGEETFARGETQYSLEPKSWALTLGATPYQNANIIFYKH